MRVVIIALSVRGAMGQFLQLFEAALCNNVELHVFVPKHYEATECPRTLHFFQTGETKAQALVNLLNPIKARELWDQVRQLKPDVVHLFNGEGYPWSLLFARWADHDKIPLLASLHDPDPHPGNVWEGLNYYLRGWTLKRVRMIHLLSGIFVDSMVQQGYDRKKLWVIPHGSIAPLFTQHQKPGVKRESAALFFGRLEEYKGIDILVEAAANLPSTIKIVIAGPGLLADGLLQKINANPDRYELQNRFIRDEEVANLFQRASVCVLPYLQVTQSSLPLIAAAFGVPVVASALGGFKEDVPRVNGLLVPPGDPVALAQGIEAAMGIVPHYPDELDFANLSQEFCKMYEHVAHLD